MVKVHRRLVGSLGTTRPIGVVLDTPFGFQENADELSAKAVTYFADSVNLDMAVASYRSERELGSIEHTRTLALIESADYVFAGPGSPSYALRHLGLSVIPQILVKKLRESGVVTFASAAAVTLGSLSAPIYEIYKVGAEPHWLDGLGVLNQVTPLDCAIIPHYDNAEGGTHDTRYCYLGERRLAIMEDMMDDESFVLGIDEHTACVCDLESQTLEVLGKGVVTIRRHGRSHLITSGTTHPIGIILDIAKGLDRQGGLAHGPGSDDKNVQIPTNNAIANSLDSSCELQESQPMTFSDQVKILKEAFDLSVDQGKSDGALQALLDLDKLQRDWATETFSSNEREQATETFRAMVVALADLARSGLVDPRKTFDPFVAILIDERSRARQDRRYEDADRIRLALGGVGVELSDAPSGTTWTFAPGSKLA